jgi:hypothetical protein
MRFDGWDTIEGRHLVFAYAAVVLIQLGYAGWMLREWLRLDADAKKARKPVD